MSIALTKGMKPYLGLSAVLVGALTGCPKPPQVIVCPQIAPSATGSVVSGRLIRSDLTPKGAQVSGVTPSGVQATNQAARVPGELVVRYRDGLVGLQGVQPAGVRAERRVGSVSVLEVETGQEQAIQASLERDPNVEAVGPNYVYKRLAIPNDPKFSDQKNLSLIGAPTAWDTQKGSANVLVAVLDDGYSPSQNDLVDRISFPIPKTGLWLDPANKDNDPVELANDAHGTAVASVIAANTNNAQAISGVAWEGVKVVPIKIFADSTTTDSTSAIVSGAIDAAVDVKARVINMSFCLVNGSNNLCSTTSDPVIDAALEKAYKSGAVLVAAAGNDANYASYVPGSVSYPALNRYVLAVGSVEDTLGRSDFSDYGSNLDLVAPGRNLWVLLNTGVGQESGTSFSAPTVAGVAGLLQSCGLTNPDLVNARLLETAQDLDKAGRDDQTGNGLVRADLALAGPDAANALGVTTVVSSNKGIVKTVQSSLQAGRSTGAYTFDGLSPGTYLVRVSVDANRDGKENSGDLVGQRSVVVTGSPAYGQDVRLDPLP
jgi:serine protease